MGAQLSAERNPWIVALIAEANDDDAALVAIYNKIKKEAINDKLLYRRKVPLPSIGVHRHNREKAMVSGVDCLSRLDEIDRVGVDLDLIQDATAFEEPSDQRNE